MYIPLVVYAEMLCTMRIIATFLLLGCLLSSCFSKRENLSSDERSFNPYNIGDQLVFQSTTNELDTFEISEIELLYNDAPIPLKEYEQTLRVWEGFTPPGEAFDQRRLLLGIHANGSDEPTTLAFFDFHGRTTKLSDIPTLNKISLSTPYGTFDDVIHLTNEPQDRSRYRNFQVFWSVNEGLLKFETGDSTVWTLVNKKPK